MSCQWEFLLLDLAEHESVLGVAMMADDFLAKGGIVDTALRLLIGPRFVLLGAPGLGARFGAAGRCGNGVRLG